MGCGSTKVSGLQPDADHVQGVGSQSATHGRRSSSAAAPRPGYHVNPGGRTPSPHRTSVNATRTSTGISKIRVTLSTSGSMIEIEKEAIQIDEEHLDLGGSKPNIEANDEGDVQPLVDKENPKHNPNSGNDSSLNVDSAQCSSGSPGRVNLQKVKSSDCQNTQGSHVSLKSGDIHVSATDHSEPTPDPLPSCSFQRNSPSRVSPRTFRTDSLISKSSEKSADLLTSVELVNDCKLNSRPNSARSRHGVKSSTLPANFSRLKDHTNFNVLMAKGSLESYDKSLNVNDHCDYKDPTYNDPDDSYSTEDEGIFMHSTSEVGGGDGIKLSHDSDTEANRTSTPELINVCASNIIHQRLKSPKRNFSSPALLQNGVNQNSPNASPKAGTSGINKKSNNTKSPKRSESGKERTSTRSRLLRFSIKTKEQLRGLSKKMSASFNNSTESEPTIDLGRQNSQDANNAINAVDMQNLALSDVPVVNSVNADLGISNDSQDFNPMNAHVHQDFFNGKFISVFLFH